MTHNNPTKNASALHPLLSVLSGLAIIACTMLAPASLALPTDKTQKIDIKSDGHLRGDAVNGVVTYSKNVRLEQGSLKIHSDELTTHGNIDKYEKIIAIGSPAILEQLPTADGALIRVEGNHIEYIVAEEKVYITGNVVFKQGDMKVEAPKFYYDVTSSFFEFDAAESEIKMTVPPKTTPGTTSATPEPATDAGTPPSEQP